MEVHPRVAARPRHRVHFQLEIAEVGAVHGTVIEEVRPRPIRRELAVHHFPRTLVLARPPAFEAVPVEQFDPPLIRRCRGQRCHRKRTDERPASQIQFHMVQCQYNNYQVGT